MNAEATDRSSEDDERRPRRGNGGHVGAGSTNSTRLRRERAFSVDVVEFLEGLDRRRRAELRVQPLADFMVERAGA